MELPSEIPNVGVMLPAISIQASMEAPCGRGGGFRLIKEKSWSLLVSYFPYPLQGLCFLPFLTLNLPPKQPSPAASWLEAKLFLWLTTVSLNPSQPRGQNTMDPVLKPEIYSENSTYGRKRQTHARTPTHQLLSYSLHPLGQIHPRFKQMHLYVHQCIFFHPNLCSEISILIVWPP